MKLFFLLIPFYFLLSACSTIGTGSAELTGLSLLHDRRSSGVIVNDERIEINAAINLNLEESIRKTSHFNVTSYNGTVLVTGETPTESLRNKIINIVRIISGVKIIHNELVITQPSSFLSRTEDTLITAKVKSALSNVKNLPGFDATRVKVVTENKHVYLLGIVHKKEGHIATEIARRENGVKQVINIFEYISY
ncbi:MAG: BON domain-containing protein [Methylococcales symbiont of Hymedesmia sp. n. MRB-2018]|nr:MAG: BON domain-containing protein [Methylococcales symbiont of Hymedesmia sp. n. MRB-2018]KAF3983116.1 MAG: BON domain-containing protein [Methylococcales symbiont of Hymedesmia sp. n. MRB-2018]